MTRLAKIYQELICEHSEPCINSLQFGFSLFFRTKKTNSLDLTRNWDNQELVRDLIIKYMSQTRVILICPSSNYLTHLFTINQVSSCQTGQIDMERINWAINPKKTHYWDIIFHYKKTLILQYRQTSSPQINISRQTLREGESLRP